MSAPAAVTAFRNSLIADTVAGAARDSQFYGNLYRGADIAAIQSVGDLSLLPVVDKRLLLEAGDTALCKAESGRIVAVQNTSGTTQSPFWLYRCETEQAFIQEFFTEWLTRSGELDADPTLVLNMVSDRHGVPTGVPSTSFPFNCRLVDRSALRHVVNLLRGEFDFFPTNRRISVISGAHDDIAMLTAHLIESGADGRSEFAVRRIGPVGRYLTRRWRGLLETFWGARVADRYSMAEIFGGASWVTELQGYVFDPYVVPEILDFSGQPAAQGEIGRMHMTSLKPFVVLQPFIRYRTGDLFSWCDGPDGTAVFKFHGREAHALFHPDDPQALLLSGCAVLEALDGHSDFNRDSHAADLGISDGSAAGWPRSRGVVERHGNQIVLRLEVETRCTMALFRRRQDELRETIGRDLLGGAPHLAALIEQKEARLDIVFAPRGSLAEMERTSRFWRIAP